MAITDTSIEEKKGEIITLKRSENNYYLMGNKICLRPLLAHDINQKYLSWLNDAEVTEYVEAGKFPTTKKELEEFYKDIKKSKTDVIFAIVTKRNDLHIGNVKISRINWIHRFADMGIIIGDKKYWGRGYGEEVCRLLLDYAFNRLNLNKVLLGSHAPHMSAIKTFQKVGFKIEGRNRKMLMLNGKYVDRIIMGILQSEYIKNTCKITKKPAKRKTVS